MRLAISYLCSPLVIVEMTIKNELIKSESPMFPAVLLRRFYVLSSHTVRNVFIVTSHI